MQSENARRMNLDMQENESNPNGTRLQRIQKISRLLKFCVLIYLIVPLFFVAAHHRNQGEVSHTISVFGDTYVSFRDVPFAILVLSVISFGLYFFGVVSFYRLLGLYEKGIIFSTANVLQMKKVGSSLLGYGIMAAAANIIHIGELVIPLALMKLFSPWILVGGTIYIIAWIMDEGRKIQEEQALTV